MEIAYVELDSFPGVKMFRCEPLHATLMIEACARNYLAKKFPSCAANCRIGLEHAALQDPALGAQIARKIERKEISPTYIELPCIRCLRSGMTASRFVGRFRLVRGKTICVSCWNREREVRIGRNAKGARPKKWSTLKATSIEVRKGATVQTVDIGLTQGLLEIFGHVQRRYPGWTLVRAVFDGKRVSENKVWRAKRRYEIKQYKLHSASTQGHIESVWHGRRMPVFMTDGRHLY